MVEVGRDVVGVLVGVPLGVDDRLSTPTRDFLEDERGVMLLLRNAFTGVTSSTTTELTLGVVALLLRTFRVDCALLAAGVAVEGAAARRGVNGVFAVRLLASFGLRLFWGFRSMGILLAYSRSFGRFVRRVRGGIMASRCGGRGGCCGQPWC